MTDLMPHQRKALGRMHNGCILKGPAGSGKTLTALAYYDDNETVERLIVITTAKKRDSGDWEAEGRALGIYPEVYSWQSLDRLRDVQGAFFIFDEQRVVGSGPWVDSFLKITKSNQWILLSATPGDSWMDYIPVFLANSFYSSRSEFLREHVVFNPFVSFPVVQRYTEVGKLEKLLESILVEMPYEKHTIRHEIDVFCEHDLAKYNMVAKRHWNFEEERPIRNISEYCGLLRKVVNTDPSRLLRIRDLMIVHPKVIIFYNYDYELEILRELCNQETQSRDMARTGTGGDSGSTTELAGEHGSTSTSLKIPGSFAVAEWNGHKHEPIPEGNEWAYLVQYSAGSEGWNCTVTDTVIFYSLTYSYRMFEQAKGRIDRLDTEFTDLYYFVLRSATKIDQDVFKTIMKKKNFNELKFSRLKFETV